MERPQLIFNVSEKLLRYKHVNFQLRNRFVTVYIYRIYRSICEALPASSVVNNGTLVEPHCMNWPPLMTLMNDYDIETAR